MSDDAIRKCPRCGGPVVYNGRGRRPVWCSARCRNEAAIVRRGAREGAVEIRMIEVPKQPRRGAGGEGSGGRRGVADALSVRRPSIEGRQLEGPPFEPSARPTTADRAALAGAVLADPAVVATVVIALCRRQQAGSLSGEGWTAIRSGIVSLADLIRTEEVS